MFNRAPVALRCTLISLDRARRVSGTKAPDLAIFVLLSSVNLFNKKSLHRVTPLTMCCQVCYATNGIALNLNVGAEHLTNERFESAELDYQQLVVR